MSACYCMGPQNGEPLCPCRMRGVTQVNGRYVRVEDLGAVPDYPWHDMWRKWSDEAPADISQDEKKAERR